MRRLAALVGIVLLGGVGVYVGARTGSVGDLLAAGGENCVTATAPGTTVPAHTVGVDGSDVSTIPAVTVPDQTATNCVPLPTVTETAPPGSSSSTVSTSSTGSSTTTTTPAPSGQVVFRGDFESCTLDDGKWLVLDELHGYTDDQNYNHGRDYIDRNNPGSGNCALRQDLDADTTRSGRADVVSRPTYSVALGQDIYYTDEFRLPSNWQTPTGWGFTVGQFVGQYPNIWATPVQTVIYGPQSGQGFNYGGLTLTLQSGKCANGTGCSTSSKYAVISPQSLTLGVWHQYVIHVHVAQDNSGVVEVWWRNRGETTWNKTVNVTGVPTLQWSNTTPNPILGTVQDFAEGYRGAASFPISIWHDSFCRATSFAAAESCF